MIDGSGAREVLEALVAGFSVLGGTMAYLSGFWAFRALADGQPPAVIAERVNEGIAMGFAWGAPAAAVAFTILA